MSSQTAIRRIHHDIKTIYKDKLDEEGIYIHVDENNIYNVKAMIIGPSDTPYQFGYYFFNLVFDDNYPYIYPKATFETKIGEVRFHPNLYPCGKICLSILGTWTGPSWTSCQSIKSILLNLQALMNKNPLTNEPGYDTLPETDPKNKEYNKLITFFNYKGALMEMLYNPPVGFEFFLPLMREHFNKNYGQIMKNIKELFVHDGEHVYSSCYGFSTYTRYRLLYMSFGNLYKMLNQHQQPSVSGEIDPSSSSVLLDKEENHKKVQRPTEKASSFDQGHIQIVNGISFQTYSDKRGYMRWRKLQVI